ncbi:Clp protease N-terminal domain-containing protein [Methyloceanibacter sp.]|uniref:Clp protease N-terminal domain-containing protein n=1 Tax=Methyloceanibacter sp. TaxID=1965321 RepID=UPI003D6D987C
MTTEMGNQGMSGFGGDAYAGTRSEPPAQSGNAGSPPFADAQPHGHAEAADAAEEVALDFDYDEAVPGFEASASDCFNRALKIARSLNHMSLSSDHLMLALTMDPSARRLLERVGDITQLREAAMQRLGRMHGRFATGESLALANIGPRGHSKNGPGSRVGT